MLVFDHACRATQGARNYQEDTAAILKESHAPGSDLPSPPAEPDGFVAVLADGMGGHAGGALASRMACDTFLEAYADATGEPRERLLRALARANLAIGEKVSQNPILSGMGSTLVGVAFGQEGGQWVSVGDSPLLLYRRGQIAPLNDDHSLAPELDRMAAAGLISPERARNDPRRHMLRSAVTGDELELVDISPRPLMVEGGDYIILASDGLQTLDSGEIERIVSAYAEDGADAVARALIRAVENIRDPHQDNTTVVAVRVIDPAPEDALAEEGEAEEGEAAPAAVHTKQDEVPGN